MSDFNYQAYLKNNPLLKEEVKEEKLLTEEKKKDVEESAPGYKHDCAAHVMHESHGYGLCLEGRHTLVETTEGHAEVTHYDVMFKNGNVVEKIPVNELKVLTSEAHTHSKYEEDDVTEVEIDSTSLTKINSEVKSVQTMAQAILDFIEQVQEKETIDFGANANMKIVLDKLNTLAKIEKKVNEAVAENEEVTEETTSKMTVSELKAKIKEDIISMLSEQEEEEDIEAEIEDEVEVDVEEPALDASDAQEGLTADEKEIQDSLKIAYDNAVAIGDTKLADQIGNSITFFTRTHVVER